MNVKEQNKSLSKEWKFISGYYLQIARLVGKLFNRNKRTTVNDRHSSLTYMEILPEQARKEISVVSLREQVDEQKKYCSLLLPPNFEENKPCTVLTLSEMWMTYLKLVVIVTPKYLTDSVLGRGRHWWSIALWDKNNGRKWSEFKLLKYIKLMTDLRKLPSLEHFVSGRYNGIKCKLTTYCDITNTHKKWMVI